MIAKVIPARRMPAALAELDYAVPEELSGKIKTGQLVKIPFLKKEVFGVVSRLEKDAAAADGKKIKPISAVIMTEPALGEAQLLFLSDLAGFYHTPLGFLVKGNLPPLQKRKLGALAETPATSARPGTPVKPSFFLYRGAEEKLKFFLDEIEKNGGQCLLLVPELPDIDRWKKLLPPAEADKCVFVTGEMGNKEMFEVWKQIRTGGRKIVIGTRRALFLPWNGLKKIFLDDEGNPDYKSWDMAPRFHTRDAALFLASRHGARLHLMSHTPSVETYYFCRQKTYGGGDALVKITPAGHNPEIIDLRDERKTGNYNFLSEELTRKIKEKTPGDVFLFLNRRGSASYVGCRDCGNTIKCPHCGFTLTYHETGNLLKCHYCGYSEPMRTHCAVCGGINMAMYGVGTQMAENSARKLLVPGDTRKVVRIDSDANDLSKLKPDGDKIIVGTQLAWPYLDWSRLRLMAFLDFDTPLFIPEYKIAENLWQMLRDTQSRLPEKADFIIQTSHPEHPLLAAMHSPGLFYESQLKERRALQYPPFKFLLKLSYGGADNAMARCEAERLAGSLATLTKDIKSVKISGPMESSPYFYGGLYWQVILVRLGYEDYKKNTKLILSAVPESWKADPNPHSILYQS